MKGQKSPGATILGPREEDVAHAAEAQDAARVARQHVHAVLLRGALVRRGRRGATGAPRRPLRRLPAQLLALGGRGSLAELRGREAAWARSCVTRKQRHAHTVLNNYDMIEIIII